MEVDFFCVCLKSLLKVVFKGLFCKWAGAALLKLLDDHEGDCFEEALLWFQWSGPGDFMRNQSLKTFPCSRGHILCSFCVFPCHIIQFRAHSTVSIKYLFYQLWKMPSGDDPWLHTSEFSGWFTTFSSICLATLERSTAHYFLFSFIACCFHFYLWMFPGMWELLGLLVGTVATKKPLDNVLLWAKWVLGAHWDQRKGRKCPGSTIWMSNPNRSWSGT